MNRERKSGNPHIVNRWNTASTSVSYLFRA